MDMQKRGQVSVFVIIGLVIIAAMIFVFFLFRSFQEKAREITNPQEYLKSQIQDVKKAVVKCIGDESEGALTKLSMQGGHLNPVKYINYYDSKVTFLCYKVKDDEPCYNFMFTRMEIEDELGPLLKKNIKSCVDSSLSPFRKKDYVLSTGDYGFDFVFSDEALLVILDYPVTLTKSKIIEIQNEFSSNVKTDFWKTAVLASSIVNSEARGEIVDLVKISPNNLYFEVGRRVITGGNLYMIIPRNGGQTFYFAVET